MDTQNDLPEITDEDIREEDFRPEELEDETVDWKAKALELKGIAKRRATQLKKAKIAAEAASKIAKEEKVKTKPNETEYARQLAESALLAAKGLDHPDDIAFLKKEAEDSGKNIAELLSKKYVLEGLKELKAARDMANAMPRENQRGNSFTGSNEDYEFAKYMQTGELPKDREMAQKVVNMRIKQGKEKSVFTDNPIVGI